MSHTKKLQSDFSLDFSEAFESPRYVCRTCFSGFKRLEQLQTELLEKVGVAIVKVIGVSNRPLPRRIGSKRKSEECDRRVETVKKHRQGDDSASENVVKSPDVSVRYQHAY